MSSNGNFPSLSQYKPKPKQVPAITLQLENGEMLAASPNIWLAAIIATLNPKENRLAPKQCLSDLQSRVLWESLLPFEYEGFAKLAQETWELMHDWDIDITQVDPMFSSWASDYQRQCVLKDFVDSATLPKEIISLLANDSGVLPARVFFLGFDNISLTINKLIGCLKSKSEIIIYNEPPPQATSYSIKLPDKKSEIKTAARRLQ